MVKDSLDAFMRDDTTLAEEVIDRDDEVDQLNYQIYRELLSYMAEDPQTIPRATRILLFRNISNGSRTMRPISPRWSCSWSREDDPAHGKEEKYDDAGGRIQRERIRHRYWWSKTSADIRELLRYNLAQEGFIVEEAGDGARRSIASDGALPDLMVLDLMLPADVGARIVPADAIESRDGQAADPGGDG
jgi:CheY-like chemotaxis protein